MDCLNRDTAGQGVALLGFYVAGTVVYARSAWSIASGERADLSSSEPALRTRVGV
jgi:hypothetical protein